MQLKFLTLLTLLNYVSTVTFEDLQLDKSEGSENHQYNVRNFVQKLNLEICVFIGIGLRYYAIFVEIEADCQDYERYFLGICHSSTLEMWRLCSPELADRNRRKCRFKPNHSRHYHPRIHRRFCDFKYMSRNADCQCIPTIFANDLKKVTGMPTCYIPPLPASLCRYNICGLHRCNVSKQRDLVNVQCDCQRPFCEDRVQLGTSAMPRKAYFKRVAR